MTTVEDEIKIGGWCISRPSNEELKKACDDHNTLEKEMNASKSEINLSIKNLNIMISNGHSEIRVLENEDKESLKLIGFYENNTVCPTCKSEISSEAKSEKINNLKHNITDNHAKIVEHKTMISDSESKITAFEHSLKDIDETRYG